MLSDDAGNGGIIDMSTSTDGGQTWYNQHAPVLGTQVYSFAALLVVYIVWGSTYLAIRVGVETIPPLLGAGTRFIASQVPPSMR